jgi:uncharacterized Zn finger protein (UPF0148 family)
MGILKYYEVSCDECNALIDYHTYGGAMLRKAIRECGCKIKSDGRIICENCIRKSIEEAK